MSILVNKNTKIIVQGFTGKEGTFHSEQCIAYKTNIVGGVTPGKGGSIHLGKPVYNTVKDAIEDSGATVSLIFVPALFAGDAIMEAANGGIKLAVVITEGIPVQDTMNSKAYATKKGMSIIGPNCPGLLVPNEAKIGIIPASIFKRGSVGLISRSGTLTYEAGDQIVSNGLGVSTAIGIGGDPITGLGYIDLLKMFEDDDETNAIVLIGEIGGTLEIEASEFIKKHISKPVVAFVAGRTAPEGRRMGHAGAIVSGGKGTAKEKIDAFRKNGVYVADNPSIIGKTVLEALQNRN